MGWFKRTFRGESKKSPNSRIKYCVPLFPVVGSIDGHSNTFFRLEMALESLIHAFGKITRDPDFSALITGLNGDVLKKVKMSFDQSVQGRLPLMQFAAALGAQRIFHSLFSLRVFGSSHFAGSSQWTVMI